MKIDFRLADHAETDIKALGEALFEFNANDVGPANKKDLAVIAYDDAKNLIAGLSGYTAWGWVYIQWLWVDHTFRGRGLASELLELAETEAKARGCCGAHIDTFNPQALRLYKRQGYQVFGELPDFVNSRTRSFLMKRWS